LIRRPPVKARMRSAGVVEAEIPADRVDRENGKITVGSETYTMDKQSGTSMMPAVGDKVTLTYKDSGTRGKRPGAQAWAERSLTRSGR
jgi:hypothetical protein